MVWPDKINLWYRETLLDFLDRGLYGSALLASVLALLTYGCVATSPPSGPVFDFNRDTFAYANQLRWQYQVDIASGTLAMSSRDEPARFGQRCPLMVRMVRQFHYGALFAPQFPKLTKADYKVLIARVLEHDPRLEQVAPNPVLIPGYAGLREFSLQHEDSLKQATGGIWKSYLQRGNWRMILPFLRSNQQQTAEQLMDTLEASGLPIVRIVRFPRITINHALLVIGAAETATEIQFVTYDPNEEKRPVTLTYSRETRTFYFPPAEFFPGGRVDVFEIYSGNLR